MLRPPRIALPRARVSSRTNENPLRPGVFSGGVQHDYPNLIPIDDGTDGYFPRAELLERAGMTQHEYTKLAYRRSLVARYKSRQRGWVLYTDEDVKKCRALLKKWLPREAAATPMGRPRKWQAQPGGAKGQLRYSKEHARQVIKRLKEGMPRDEIFLELDLHPDTISLISRDYEIMIGGFYVDGTMVERINRLPIEGVDLPISTARDLMALLDQLFKDIAERRCSTCDKNRPSDRCTACMRAMVMAEVERKAARAAVASAAASANDSSESEGAAAQ